MYYEDDHYHPANQEGNFNRDKAALSEMKQMDKGYRKIKRLGYKKAPNGDLVEKMMLVEVYCSGDVGTHIRNAVTGHRYPYRVGSKEEDLLFKVGLATGELGVNSGSLFYDSPEQYEKHCFTTISTEGKNRWHEKNLLSV